MFTHRLHTLSKLTDRLTQGAYLSDAGIALSEGRCLSAIGSFTPLSVKDLAYRANLDKGQASRAAQSLVDQGLVLKAASPTDGRGVVLTLTPEGRTAWERAMDVVAHRNKDIFGVLSADEQTRLSSFFDRLIEHAQAGGELAEDIED